MNVQDFTLAALTSAGAKISPSLPDLFSVEENGGRYYIRFSENSSANVKSVLFNETSSAFQRLVDRVVATGLHTVEDLDHEPEEKSNLIVRDWVDRFGGRLRGAHSQDIARRFEGAALIRVRATVLHDSYERLVEVPCLPSQHVYRDGKPALKALQPTVSDLREIGINREKLAEAATLDEAISEFSRFYLERREHEVNCAGSDERKRRKLHDEFTPRFEASVVALEGKVWRELSVRVEFDVGDDVGYEATIKTIPSIHGIIDLPPVGECARTGKRVPVSCLAKCQMSGAQVLRHLLVKSEFSDREVLPEYTELCSVTGKRVVKDELATSDISGEFVIRSLLRKSGVSGKQAEKELFSKCNFTNVDALKSELRVSEISGRAYRFDQEARSELSGKAGHKSEFLNCSETRQLLAASEAEQCQETHKLVRPGVLIVCEESGQRVLPSECGRCSVTNKRVLKRLLVNSSLSGAPVMLGTAVRSESGLYCLPAETQLCAWTGQGFHPDDIGTCTLTTLRIHKQYLTTPSPRLRPLFELLNDVSCTAADRQFPVLEATLSKALDGKKCRMVSGAISPTKNAMAVCAEVKSHFGLKTNYVGCVFVPNTHNIAGKIAVGKRTKRGWSQN